MRIVIASEFYVPMINGVAMFSYNLARGLVARGHTVLVLAPSVDGEYKVGREDGVRVARLTSKKIPLYPDQIKKVDEKDRVMGFYKNGIHMCLAPYKEVRVLLDKFKPDVIHNQTPGTIGLAVQKYAKRRRVPLVATGHAYPDNLTGQLRYLKLIKKPTDAVVRNYFLGFLKRADWATIPTKLAMDDLLPKRGIKTPTEALSNGIDLSRFRPLSATAEIYTKYGIPRGRPIVGYVGRVDPEKTLGVLVRAFATVHAKVPKALLVVVGDGTDLVRLQKQAQDSGIDKNVKFLGRVVGDDLPVIYRTFDIFAITSETETQSIVLMEAMATGLPAVAVEAGAIGELVLNGKNGFLCQPKDVTGVAKGIVALLQNAKMCEEYGKQSLEIIKKHDITYTLMRFEQIYEKVIARKAIKKRRFGFWQS